jgi:hypothetical protein
MRLLELPGFGLAQHGGPGDHSDDALMHGNSYV